MSYIMSSLNPSVSAASLAIKNHCNPTPILYCANATSTHNTTTSISSSEVKKQELSDQSLRDHVPNDLIFSNQKGRVPQMGRAIVPNERRPGVPAKERLYFWRTPYGDNHLYDLHTSLPRDLAHTTCLTVRSALKPESVSTYGAGVLRFTQFCDEWKIPECERMPASYALLSAFISANAGKSAGNTIKTWLSGIHAWHTTNHAPWYGDDNWVRLCRTVANREGTIHEKPARPPVSLEHLFALYRAIDLAIPLHAAIWAAATVACFGCRRLGEILIKNRNSFDSKYHVLRSANPTFRDHNGSSKSVSFHIPWTKVTKEKGADVVVTARLDRLCPVAACLKHFLVNNDLPANAPLFAYKSTNGKWHPLLKDVFLNFVNRVWSDAQLDYVYGHSFRIGGAVALLLAGVPPEVVAATGGWTSLSFLLYWRRLEDILPKSTSRAYNSSDLNFLFNVFENFRKRCNIPKNFLDSFNSL